MLATTLVAALHKCAIESQRQILRSLSGLRSRTRRLEEGDLKSNLYA